jgi:hypothetical protein
MPRLLKLEIDEVLKAYEPDDTLLHPILPPVSLRDEAAVSDEYCVRQPVR